jgi:ATP-dependent DNA helicase DinG
MREFFKENGIIASVFQDYTFRPQQLEMAQLVADAIDSEKQLVVEAGTGTGKTLAYLIPIIDSGSQAIISTGTKVLQHQLFEKDIPVASKIFNRNLNVTLLKGRQNYFCLLRFNQFNSSRDFEFKSEIQVFNEIKEWAKYTENGDFAELEEYTTGNSMLRKLNADKNYCTARKCPYYDECYLYEARKKALNSDIVLVNHHLLFSDSSVKSTNYGSILPVFPVLVIDEAHGVEDIASNQLGFSFTPRMVSVFVSELPPDIKFKYGHNLKEMLKFEVLQSKIAGNEFKALIGKDLQFHFDELRNIFLQIKDSLKEVNSDEYELKENMMKRAENIILFFDNVTNTDYVSYYEKDDKTFSFKSVPVDVSTEISKMITENYQTAIFTSATLSVSDSLQFYKTRVGLVGSEEKLLKSPFNYNENTIFYLAEHLPDVNASDFLTEASKEIEKIVALFQGKTFVLCTSLKNMHYFAEYLRSNTDFNVLKQNDSSSSNLLSRFRLEKNSVLVASFSFWEGVDIKGCDLSCVIIDKLPFPQPTDPVFKARANRVKNSFYNYSIPLAVLKMKQGFGRLIRDEQDLGAFVLLDNRLTKKSYGKPFLNSIYTDNKVRKFEKLKYFWEQRIGK